MLYRLEQSSGGKKASASPQRSLRDRSGNRRVQELEQQSDVPSDSASPKRRQPESTHEIVGQSGQEKNVSLTACTTQINKPGSRVFMCRKNRHLYQRIQNLLMKDRIIWSLHMYFLEMKLITYFISNMFGLLVC